MTNPLIQKSRLKDYFFNFLNSYNKETQSNLDWEEFYQISFNTSRNKKTSEVLDIYSSFLSSEDKFISDNILIVDSLFEIIQKLSDNSFIIADRTAIDFIKTCYNFSINKRYICFIDEIGSGKDLESIIKIINKTKFLHLLAIGGGRTLDFAKFISLKGNKKLMSIPSSLATHVYASPKIHVLPPIKELGYSKTINGESSHLSLIDSTVLNVLFQKNKRLILSGFGDLMAFINAKHDWIQSSNKCKERYSIIVDESIDFIVSKLQTIDINKPLKNWIEDYIFFQCLLCNITHWIGSAPASGAEHLFAKCIEDNSLESPIHGEVVALGVMIFSYIRNKDVEIVQDLFKKFNISNSFSDLNLNKNQIIDALNKSLMEGNNKNRDTILNNLDISYNFFENVINEMINKKLLME